MPELLTMILLAAAPKVIEKVFERAIDRYWPTKNEFALAKKPGRKKGNTREAMKE